MLFEMGDEVEMRAEYRQLASKVFDTRIFYQMQQGNDIVLPANATSLHTTDLSLVNEIIGSIQYMKRVNIAQLIRSQNLLEKAKGLIIMIKDEYHVK